MNQWHNNCFELLHVFGIGQSLLELFARMDADLYDEFGNYIGPTILSDEEVEDDDDSVADGKDDDVDGEESQLLEQVDESLAVRYIIPFSPHKFHRIVLQKSKFIVLGGPSR